MNQAFKNSTLCAGLKYLSWLGLFAACTVVPEAWAQAVAHPLAGETLAVKTASQDASAVSFKDARKEAMLYQLPFRVDTVSNLYLEGQRALLVGATRLFEFGASYAAPAQAGKPDAVMIGYGFAISPNADYLAWVQFYPPHALDPDRGTVRLIKMTEAFGLKAPLDELKRDAGVVLYSAPSEEIRLYPNLKWSDDGRLAFLSEDSVGQAKVVVCRASTTQCRNVGSVEVEKVDRSGKHHRVNRITKLNFVPEGISLDLVSSSSKKNKQIFPTP
jgi:hypothetical protein